MLGKYCVVECSLLNKEKPRPLRNLRHDPRPYLPVRGVAAQGKNAAIDHWIAAETVGGTPAECLPVVLPRQSPAEQFRSLVVALIGTVDLRGDRQLAGPRGAGIQLDPPPVLQPGICVDPEVSLVAREVARQEGPRELRLERFRG